jgi:acyl carrier protein
MARQHAAQRLKDRDRDQDQGEELRARVQTWIIDWFESRAKTAKQATESLLHVDYFEAGWLTSMEVVEFVTEIEQTFGMQFSDDDMQDPRFATIAGLTELVLERSTQSSESR